MSEEAIWELLKKCPKRKELGAVEIKGSAQEFVEARILSRFLKNDEFSLGDRHALSLEQQIAEILVAATSSKKGFDVAVDGLQSRLSQFVRLSRTKCNGCTLSSSE